MNWDDIRLFLALARTHRLGTAGRVVGQNATTVARRIQRLEEGLETTLFEHTLSGYVLTQAGQAVLAKAEEMERDALAIVHDAGANGVTMTGAIRLSVSEGFGSNVLAPRLVSFTAAHPGVTVDLIASTGFLNPSRREADLAIMLSRPKSGPLIVRKLTDYRLGLYARADATGGASRPERIEDLLARPLIGYVPDLIYAPELNYLSEIDARLHPSVRSSSINAQAELIASGAGCGVLPCFLAARMPALVRVLPEQVAVTRSFWLVVHRDIRRIARIERFIAWLHRTVEDVAPVLAGAAT